MSSFLPAGGSGTGGGILYPDSAARPFASNSARNTWANNNKADLIKDTTVVNVGGNQWYLWTGESNPDNVNNNLWMDADQIVPGEKGDRGDPGIDVTTATVNADGDLIVTLSNGSDINAGRARGEDGDLVYQQLPAADYANFFDADWSTLGTNIYGVTALGSQFANAPFPLNASTTYSFECLLVNEPNQYSLRVTSMANADFDNAGRDAILSGLTKTAAEAVGWKVYAFTSDPGHADPTEGFDLQPNADIGLDNTSALTIKNNAGDVHNAIDQDTNLDAIRIGSPVMRSYLRTGTDRIQVQTSNGMKDIAHLEDIASQTNPDRLAYWVREQNYALTADDIGKEIILAVQPQVDVNGTREVTITFPNQAAFTNHYYVPDVSPAGDEATKPHIETFRFSLWAYYFQASPVKITLLSDGNWLPFVSSESLSEEGGVYLYRESEQDANELHTFAFMRPINHNPAVGVQGWVLQNVHPYSWLPLTSQPPSSPPISTLGTFMINDDESGHLRTGAGINSTFDAQTGEHTLTVDPTNIDLSGYAELDTDVSFSKVTVKNTTDPLYESVFNVTNGGNTEANLVGTTNLRKVDKATGTTTDVMNINGTSGAVDLRTDVTYQGAITDDKAVITKEYLEAFGRGLGVPEAIEVSGGNTYQQTAAVALFSTVGTDINDVLIQIDATLPESETIISMPYDLQISSKNFDIEQIVGQGTTRNIRAGDTWKVRMIVDQNGANRWFWEKVYSSNSNVVYGLTGRNDIIDEVGVKAFAYAEGMPYHLLLETPTSSRLFHEFPKSKTHRFTPIDSNRRYEGVTINTSNEAGPTVLGEYSDLPLYTFEPNVVINRDQVGYMNFPADMTIDTSQGFYFFGTVSGWAGGAQNNGTTAVYVGTNADNPKAGGSKIGFALIADRLVILTGNDAQDAVTATASRFNLTNGVANFYRFAVYVDLTGMMTYYIVNLNNRVLHTGQQQCDLGTVSNNPKLWVAYDREAANTSTVAVGEIHLVLETEGEAEQMWNWRN